MTIAKINFFTFDLKSIELNYDFTSTDNSQYAFSSFKFRKYLFV